MTLDSCRGSPDSPGGLEHATQARPTMINSVMMLHAVYVGVDVGFS